MVGISKLSWEVGGKIRSSKLHTNSVRACISLAPKQINLENELSRGNVQLRLLIIMTLQFCEIN